MDIKKGIDNEIEFLELYFKLLWMYEIPKFYEDSPKTLINYIMEKHYIILKPVVIGVSFDLDKIIFFKFMNYVKLKLENLTTKLENRKSNNYFDINKISKESENDLKEFLGLSTAMYGILINIDENNLFDSLIEHVELVLKKYNQLVDKEIEDFYKINQITNQEIETFEKIENNPELKSQTANFLLLNELGIIEHLKNKYSDNFLNDTDFAKLICQIMRYEKETEIKSMRKLIETHRNNPKKVETEKAKNEVKQILLYHKLI